MADFGTVRETVEALEDAQDIERDIRIAGRESEAFIHVPGAQWEEAAVRKRGDRIRLQFDGCENFIHQILSQMMKSEFMSTISAAAGGTEEIAKIRDGMIRSLEIISKAKHIYSYSGRDALETGFSAWRLRVKYLDGDSFYQDLMMEQIYNAIDHVWFDTGAKEQSKIDADWCIVETALRKDKYDKLFPNGSGNSLGNHDSRLWAVYPNRDEQIIIGELFYKKKSTRELVLMSDQSVYVVDEKYEQISDDLGRKGVIEVERRERETSVVHQKMFDATDWLEHKKGEAEKETVFEHIPVIPVYMNYKIIADQTTFRASHEKLKDIQRAINYIKSAQIEDFALSPGEKTAITGLQSANYKKEHKTMNTDHNPLFRYDHIEGHVPPFKMPKAGADQGALSISAELKTDFEDASGQHSANKGENRAVQSGVALNALIDQGNNIAFNFYRSMEIAVQHNNMIANSVLSKIYSEKRIVNITKADGAEEAITLHDVVFDEESGEAVEMNDLSKGTYKVVSTLGPAFQSQQLETVQGIKDIAVIVPGIVERNSDILIKNIPTPGMDKIAERERERLLFAGGISESEQTDDEKEKLQQRAQQQQEPSAQEAAMTKVADAEAEKAMAITQKTTTEIGAQTFKQELQTADFEQDRKESDQKFQLEREKLKLQREKQRADIKATTEDTVKKMAETLKIIEESTAIKTQADENQAKKIEGAASD
jgi:hypothetical protein